MKNLTAYCYASGEVEFTDFKAPKGTIWIATGHPIHVRGLLEVTARQGRKEGVLLVPGVPEARNQREAGDALAKFLTWLRGRSDVRALGIEINAEVRPQGA